MASFLPKVFAKTLYRLPYDASVFVVDLKKNTSNLIRIVTPTSNNKSNKTDKPSNSCNEDSKKVALKKKLEDAKFVQNKHFVPQNFTDWSAFGLVKLLRTGADIYFQKRYIDRVTIIETVAAIPGLVGGLFRHLYSLRNFNDNGDTIKKLVAEAENERQHLMTFLELKKPNILDKIIVRTAQFGFFTFYFILYGLFPQVAHRFVGYLEEEAVRSYNCFEEEILIGNIENVLAPKRAIEYWKLQKNAKLVDVVRAIRADEERHRDTNHSFANQEPFRM